MSERSAEAGAWQIRLREPEESLLASHLRQPLSWVAWLREMEHEWRRYMQEHDSPEQRWREKNLERFRLP